MVVSCLTFSALYCSLILLIFCNSLISDFCLLILSWIYHHTLIQFKKIHAKSHNNINDIIFTTLPLIHYFEIVMMQKWLIVLLYILEYHLYLYIILNFQPSFSCISCWFNINLIFTKKMDMHAFIPLIYLFLIFVILPPP